MTRTGTAPKGIAAGAALLLATLLLTVQAPPGGNLYAAAAPPSTFRIGETQEPDSLNPFIAISSASYAIFSTVYDLLVGIGEDLTPVPQLARNWSVSADGLAWTFNLYPGVVWHDDTPTTPRNFTSADVKFTIEYIQTCRLTRFLDYVGDPTDPAATFIRQIDAASPTTVVIHTNKPKANIFILPPILPQHVWSQVTCLQARQNYKNVPPVGTGMYRFVQWQNGQFLRLVLHDRYHLLQAGKDYVDEIIYRFYNSEASLLSDFLLGNLDGTGALTAQQFLSLPLDIDGGTANPDADPDPDITKFVQDSLELAELGFCSATDALITEYGVSGNRHWLSLNLTVRQAVANAIDKTRLVDLIWSGTDAATGALLGLAKPGDTLIPPATPFWHYNVTAQEELPYDLGRAAARLSDPAGDGWTTTDGNPPNPLGSNLDANAANNRDAFGDLNGDGVREVLDMAYVASRNPEATPQANRGVRGSAANTLRFGIWILNSDGEGIAAADAFIPELASIGIAVVKEMVSFQQLLGASYLCDYDSYIWGWFFGVDPDFGLSVMTKNQIRGWQDAWYYNATYDAWYLEQQTKVDLYERQAIVHAMQRLLYRDQPYNILWYPQYFAVARSDRFTNWGDWTAHPGLGFTGYGNVFTMLRVVPVFPVANQCPILVAIEAPVQPRVVFAGAVANFNGTAIDPEGDALNWTWDWKDGNVTLVSTGAGNASVTSGHAWSTPGDYNITLTVDDGLCGGSVTATPVWVRVLMPPPPIGWITGTVTEASSGLIIAGATVSATPGGANATSAADGTYNISVAPGNYTVTASRSLYISQSQAANVSQGIATTVNFQLQPQPGWIAGTVTDASSGAPIAGATIVVIPGGANATTAADGTYNISLGPGTYTATASRPLYGSQSLGATVVSAATTSVDFQLTPGAGWLVGTVTNAATGAPISGATLTLVPGGLTTTTAPDGTYNLSVAPGTYTAVASKSLYTSSSQSATVVSGVTTILDFQLQPVPGWIAGTVTDATTGLPIPGATITVSPGGFIMATAADGTYNVTVAPDTYAVTASKPLYVAQTQGATVTSNATTTADFPLGPVPGWIAGTVTNAATGAPIAGATIAVNPGGISTVTAVDGTYNVTVASGTYTATASKALFLSQSQAATVASAATSIANLQLTPMPGWIAGLVTDSGTGAPVAGASVTIAPGGASTTTAADGSYNVSLGPGSYTVTVSKSLYVSQARSVVVASDATALADISLVPAPGWISGTVTDAAGGAPLAGVSLKAVGTSGQEFPVTSASDGSYNITLAPGTYTIIVVQATGYVNQSRTSVAVTSAQTTPVDFPLVREMGWISGTVTDATTGSPLAGVSLKAVDSMGREYPGVTQADGTYTVPVPSGTYTVIVVLAPGHVNQTRSGVNVADGQTVPVNFPLAPVSIPPAGIASETILAGAALAVVGAGLLGILLLRRRKKESAPAKDPEATPADPPPPIAETVTPLPPELPPPPPPPPLPEAPVGR